MSSVRRKLVAGTLGVLAGALVIAAVSLGLPRLLVQPTPDPALAGRPPSDSAASPGRADRRVRDGADHPPPQTTTTGAATDAATKPTAAQLPTLPGLDDQRFDAVVRRVAEREDPVLDGWDSEHFHDLADRQLKRVGQLLLEPEGLDTARVASVTAPKFSSPGLRPAKLRAAFAGDSLTVLRGSVTADVGRFPGHDGVVRMLREQAAPLAGLADRRFKFKIVRVDLQPAHTDTTAYFQISGRQPGRATQINATWHCRWLAGDDPEQPLLAGITVEDYEEVVYSNPRGGSLLADCTASVFRDVDRFARQLVYGIDHWTDRFDGAIARPAAGHGIAVGDVNGDGLEDVYLCQSPALPNMLLIQNPDGTVRDNAAQAGVNWLEGTRAALLADLDNDGDQDLVVVFGGKVVIHANDGKGDFQQSTIVTTPSSLFSISAVDYDNDADLDLFICGYTLRSGVNLDDVFANPMPFHDANNGAPNVLLRNDGGWNFTDVTGSVGLDQNGMRFSYAAAWEDFDTDGDQDLYVANDFGRNNLYRNDGGRFVDVAAELGVEDIGPGMSVSWGDYDNNGRPDIYVSNMFSSAGNRITHQQQFKTSLDDEARQMFRRHARGNSLFQNTGGQFHDRGVDLGVTLGRWAWGSLFVDIDNDGWDDVYVTNGFITADDGHDL
jgi:hypothetical protein